MAYDCFLSYASQDLAHAEAVHARLTAAGFTVWFDKARLQPGYDWHKEIEEGCETSRVVLPLLTQRWKQSEWTRYETYGAEAVIPLLVEGEWPEVSTPPLTPFQNFCVPLATAMEADWQRLFESIREFCARDVPHREQRVHRLRYHPAKHFVGREKNLDEIHEKLFVNPTAALTQGHVQAIAAMGGVGKTTLARQYAEKFWRCYPQMFWVDCRMGLETEFAAIHDILRPEPVYVALSTKDKAAWVRFEFSQSANRPRRLLILDNADDEESVLEWISKTGNCHTLITSRFTGWSSGIETYRVWVLDPEPARELLLRRSGRADTPAEREACDALAKKLEYLPLALEQSAAYVGAQPPGWGFAEYLRLYEANERAFLTKKTPGATEYPDSVYLTWRATIAKLSQGARAIVQLHAFMASTPTPVAMFVRGVDRIVEEAKMIAGETGTPLDEDIKGAGEFAVREWISFLAKYSMVQLQHGDSFSVHGLVHAVEWHAMGEKRAGVLQRTTRLFLAYAARPSWEPESRQIWDLLLPHAERLNEAGKKLGVARRVDLLDRIWHAYDERGEYGAAVRVARQCVHLSELELGSEHPVTLASVASLSYLLEKSGDYAASEASLPQTLDAMERVLGPEHPSTLTTINNLAALLYNKGNYAAAEPLFRHALEVRERVLGPEHPDTLASVNYLALLMSSRGNYASAEPLFRRALEAREHVLGPDHPHTITSLNNLAELLRSRGDYTASEPFYRRALEVTERTLGTGHPSTLTSVNNLALLLYSKGDYKGAEPLYRRAIEGWDRLPAHEHPDSPTAVNNLAVLLYSKGDYAAAEPLLRRALAARERILGAEHARTLESVNNLAALLYSNGNYVAAEPLFRRALAASERILGPEHPVTLTSVGNLAGLLQNKREYTAAEPLYRRALETAERVLGPDHANTIALREQLATILKRQALDAPTDDVLKSVSVSPDGQATVAASGDKRRVWDDPKTDTPYEAAGMPLEHASIAGHPDVVRVLLDAPEGTGATVHDVVSGGLEDFRCSVFYPERVYPREVSKIVASVHLQEVASVAVREAAKRLELAAGKRMKAGSTHPKLRIRRHVGIDVTVDIPGLTFEATRARLQVWEDQQFVEFRFKPAAASAASLCQGRAYFWLEGMILADVAVSILVTAEAVPEIFREHMVEVNARPYRFVFPSYSHEDADIVEQFESYAAAFGDEYLRDIRRLRAGQRWNEGLLGFIKKADVFQLFWSSRAADSEYVGQEWKCGLLERESRPDPYFVRPVYWTDSPAPIPDALKSLHFAKVSLVGH